MILLDPQLEPGPSAPGRRLSARSLARFLAEAQHVIPLCGQVTVLLTSDATLRDLNARFRGKDRPTDVLSFPAADQIQNQKKSKKKIAGDLAISVDTARRQAAEQGHALSLELKILILHGLLHLAGYDHESDSGRMHRRERQLRTQLGLPQGLIERASTHRASSPKVRSTAGSGCPILSRSLRKGGKTRTSVPATRSRTP